MSPVLPNVSCREVNGRLARIVGAGAIALAVAACGRESEIGSAVPPGTERVTALEAAAIAPGGSATRDSVARARQDSINRAQPGYVIDSLLPVDEEIRRFQSSSGERPVGFGGGARSRDALVRSFFDAIERSDDRSLRRLVVDRAEFAFLVYPTSPNTKPPYRLSPDLVWMHRSATTDKAATRLLQRFGARGAHYAGYSCVDPGTQQGANRLWMQCVVRLRTPGGDSAAVRLFGPIIERAGTYKFLSLANGL